MRLLTKNGYKFEVVGYPRHEGVGSGHLSECLLVDLASGAEDRKEAWPPPADTYGVFCTCDDWSPE